MICFLRETQTDRQREGQTGHVPSLIYALRWRAFTFTHIGYAWTRTSPPLRQGRVEGWQSMDTIQKQSDPALTVTSSASHWLPRRSGGAPLTQTGMCVKGVQCLLLCERTLRRDTIRETKPPTPIVHLGYLFTGEL